VIGSFLGDEPPEFEPCKLSAPGNLETPTEVETEELHGEANVVVSEPLPALAMEREAPPLLMPYEERYGHFLMPSLRQADFMAVAEMPRRTAASCKGSVKSWRRMVSLRTTGLLLTRVCSPAFRRGKMVFLESAPSSAAHNAGGDGARVLPSCEI